MRMEPTVGDSRRPSVCRPRTRKATPQALVSRARTRRQRKGRLPQKRNSEGHAPGADEGQDPAQHEPPSVSRGVARPAAFTRDASSRC